MSRELEPARQSRIILYTTADGRVTVDVVFAQENFWLTQKAMAELFGVQIPAISRHLKNIYVSGELTQEPSSDAEVHVVGRAPVLVTEAVVSALVHAVVARLAEDDAIVDGV